MAGNNNLGQQHMAIDGNLSQNPRSQQNSTTNQNKNQQDVKKDPGGKEKPQLGQQTSMPSSTGGNKKTANRRNSQLLYNSPLSYEEVAALANSCSTEEKLVFVAKQVLGSGNANGFQKAISTMQRLKRQRARTSKQKESEKSKSSSKEDQEDEEQLKKKTFNVRFAKRMQEEMKHGLQFTNLMQGLLREILEKIDPENPVLLLQPPLIGNEASFASMPPTVLPPLPSLPPMIGDGGLDAATAISDMMFDPGIAQATSSSTGASTAAKFPPSTHLSKSLSNTSDMKIMSGKGSIPESPKAARKAALAARLAENSGSSVVASNQKGELASEDNPNGSTLRKLRKKIKNPATSGNNLSDAELAKLVGEHDDSGKKLPKKEIANRLFEATRYRALEKGDYVAAKVASQDLMILARVAKRWSSSAVGSYKQMALMADKLKRDAFFKERVLIQDNDDYNGNSSSDSRSISRLHVLPLPRSFAEASDWASMRLKKNSRVYAMYPNTTALYCATVVDPSTYCRNQDE